MPDFSPETLQTARNAGYTDDQIYDYWSQKDPRFDTARQAGYKLDDVASHLSAQKAPSLPTQVIQPQMGLADMLFDPQTAQNLRGAVQDVVYSIPGMVTQFPKVAYHGYTLLGHGTPQEQANAIMELGSQGISQGKQMASDIQAPLGSRESFRGIANLGLMAAPAVGEAVGEAVLLGRAKPPIQPITEAIPKPEEVIQNAEQISEPAQVHGDVQYAPRPEEGGGEMPANVGGEGVPPRGQGEIVQQTPQEVVPRGMVRLYHGSSEASPQAGRDFTTSRQYAEDYAAKAEGEGTGKVWYVDVPEGTLKTHDETGQPMTRVVVPDEIANKAQPVPQPEQPTTQESPLVQQVNEGLAAGEQPPISTKNAYTEAQRVARGFREAEQAAKRDFGTVWDEAAAQAQEDPGIGRRLVQELNSKPREISDTENAHLLRTQIATQSEHSAAVEAVNNAKTPEDLTAAKSRLELARNDLQDVYDATKRAGTKSGRALAARQMLAKEDYTLASMEARRRAANNGLPLNEEQLSEVSALHEKIADLQSKLDAHEVAQKFNTEFARLVNETRKEARAARATTKFNDFLDRKADEARARIIERRGRLTTGFDPSMIADEAIIGASHIAKGITKFADWSVKMVDEFGDAVRPFLKDIWEKARAFHAATGQEYGEKALARYKTYLTKQTEQIKGKLEAGDFTKAERQRTKLDAEAFTMRANLQKLKNEFERGVAKEAYQKKSPAQQFWDHFVGVERAMKLSGPEVFGKLGVAAFAREAGLAPAESAVGYGVSKLFPRLTEGTKYGADLSTVIRAEIKAKAAMFTKGMQDAAQNVRGKETELDAISGTKIRPDFWYNRIGQMHAAIKAPVKRAEFTRSLEQRMDAAVKAGEDIHHPEVMTRLANEAVMDANRAIFQQNTIVSNFFSMVDKKFPAGGRVARFFFPVVKIPVNLFKELVTYHVGAPVAAAKIGRAYWKGVETLPVAEREAIVRQLTKGSVGGAALLWGYFNSDKVRHLFDNAPQWFNHTPIAMVLNEGSYLKKLQGTDPEKKEGAKELAYMAKTDIPFMYSVKAVTDALDTHNSKALIGWINNMVQSTTVPQILTQTAKAIDKPGSFPSNLAQRPNYRVARNPVEAVKLGIPGLRQTVPVKTSKPHKTSRERER